MVIAGRGKKTENRLQRGIAGTITPPEENYLYAGMAAAEKRGGWVMTVTFGILP